MQGATHKHKATGEPVKATHWRKDGDHPGVERYPIERREYKGLLTAADGKTKIALHFGDWIVEDAKGRAVARSPEQFAADYAAIKE
jgi:hypothetical protein